MRVVRATGVFNPNHLGIPFNQIDLSASCVQEIEGRCLRIAQETKSSDLATFVDLASFAA
jgi:hypothetical protein